MNTLDISGTIYKNIYIPPPSSSTKKRESGPKLHPPPKKRIITTTKRWDFQPRDLTLEYQLSLLGELRNWWNERSHADTLSYDGVRTPELRSNEVDSVGVRGITGEDLSSKVIGPSPDHPRIPTLSTSLERRSGILAHPPPSKHIQLVKQLIHSKWYGYRTQDMEKNLYSVDDFLTEMDIVDLLFDSRLLCFYCQKEIQLLYEHVRETLQWSIERIDNKKGHNRGNVVIACLGCNVRRKTMYYERFRATKQLVITRGGT